ncbi:MAG TPA: DUF4912 domain-containing protein [Chthoniobacterales bacterium]|nr:DUF4912 domain-containing protein [Chthoniobacterales bacterium]
MLFAIARDPQTLFVYWNIDWPAVFEKTAPVDRQVHLRLHRSDGTEEATVAVEPMAGNFYLKITEPQERYEVEIGYYHPESVWNSVATSDEIKLPPERAGGNGIVDLATIPFHLSFQRLIDSFGTSNRDRISELVSQLQTRAITDDERALLSAEELEILNAMNLSVDEIKAGRRAFLQTDAAALRRRAENLAGFGGSSPERAFSESSWS